MRLLSALATVLIGPLAVIAAEPVVGQKVFWKTGAEAKVGNTVIDIQTIPFPATVLSVNGEWLWLDKAWVRQRDVMSTQEALNYFTEQTRKLPGVAAGWHGRGSVWVEMRQLDAAINDFTEAIRLDPKDASAFYNRGTAWQTKGQLDKAISDYGDAIRLDPKDAAARINRGNTLGLKRDFDAALLDFEEAIKLDPSNPAPYNYIAWIRATCHDPRYRDANESVKFATKACELTAWKSPVSLDTLAAAHAEAQDFDKAIESQKIAIELSSGTKLKGLKERLSLYQSHQAYRETPVK